MVKVENIKENRTKMRLMKTFFFFFKYVPEYESLKLSNVGNGMESGGRGCLFRVVNKVIFQY